MKQSYILHLLNVLVVASAISSIANAFVVSPSMGPSLRNNLLSATSSLRFRPQRRKWLRSTLLATNIIIVKDDDDDDDDDDDEDDDGVEEQVDPYLETAATEFIPSDEEPSRKSIIRSDDSAITTGLDWGGALGQLDKRIGDIETGKSQDPSHALFRVMSSQTPNQQIGQFIASTKPAVIQAMSGAVSSLLGGLWQPMNGSEVVVKASGEKISSLCFQLQMTGYMFRNAEYVMALKELMDIQPSATLDDYRNAFEDLDTDGSGYIDATEVEDLLDEVYEGKTPAFEVDSFIKFFDTNKDGRISWDEFERGLGSALAKANKANARLKMLAGHDDDDDEKDHYNMEPTIVGELEIELDDGEVVKVEAADYIQSLKQEAKALKAALRQEKLGTSGPKGATSNSVSVSMDEFGGIASYIASRQGDLKALTDGISPEIVETMKKLIDFVLEGGDSGKIPKDVRKEEMELELPGAALHQLALWQLVLGYRLREAEAKGDYLKLLE
ncbi:hypothetical protein MPSEU_000561800 [Mayamaea pseudoterrestris]|nr:hypothetical protein MPSEU_000561800 [Mayamaea pseudoterrestris]